MIQDGLRSNRFRQSLPIIARNMFLVPHILRNYRDIVLRGRRRLRALEISITYECPLRCDQCSCAKSRDATRK